MTDEQVIEEAAASNQLALAQCFVLERGSGGRGSEQFRKLDAVRRVGMRLVEHQLVAGASDADVEFILRNLVLDNLYLNVFMFIFLKLNIINRR